MSFQLDSEPLLALVESNYRLTPMSIQLGSEQGRVSDETSLGLTPMSIQLGSEPLFSNLYLILT